MCLSNCSNCKFQKEKSVRKLDNAKSPFHQFQKGYCNSQPAYSDGNEKYDGLVVRRKLL